MTTISAIPLLSSHQLPGVQEQSLPLQWLDRVDSNNRRRLAPPVANAIGALTQLASHYLIPGPWRAVSSFFYTVNILLVPSSLAKFTSNVIRWPIVAKLDDIRTVFQSTIPLLISTTFSAIGVKEACQLLGHSVTPLASALNATLPWITSFCKVNAFFQLYDIAQGIKLKSEITQALQLKTISSSDKVDFCVKILSIIEKHRNYLQRWEYLSSRPKWITVIHTQMEKKHVSDLAEEKLFRLTEKVRKATNSLLEWSYGHVSYQARGFFASALNIVALGVTNLLAAQLLLLGASVANILREICKKDE